MDRDSRIASQVYTAKSDKAFADSFIRSYIPFIKKEVSAFINRVCTDSDDEYSIGLMAFYEAIRGYDADKGAFLSYAKLTVKSRLIDFARRESRHLGHISIDDDTNEEERPYAETLADSRDYHSEQHNLDAAKSEIAELVQVMAEFGISLEDVSENSPRQQRTAESCRRIVQYAVANPTVLDELVKTKKLPVTQLALGADVEKKTIERHRRYILAMLIIQTNGFEILRGHLRRSLMKGGMDR